MNMHHNPAPSLSLENVSFHLKNGKPLVSGISLDIRAGEILAIVGPNGAGKTTLIRMIAGLARNSGGHLLLNGKPVHAMSFPERAKKIAYVGQADNPDKRLTVEQYVRLGLLPQGNRTAGQDRRVDESLETAGLGALADRRLDGLSGGEMQKAKIARAICQNPELLVLDEPTNHLDPHARGELLSIVAQTGTTVVAALHDLPLIDSFADRVAVIADGRLSDFGAPETVLDTRTIEEIFNVGFHRFLHPEGRGMIPALDIRISRAERPAPQHFYG